MCGGTSTAATMSSSAGGLSPRVRGNPVGAVGKPVAQRSIPACAGEPAALWRKACAEGVYPRVCGGTVGNTLRNATPTGLSPRVRGNPTDPELFTKMRGSIPACAGEPTASRRPRSFPRVYPRVCGGTLHPLPRQVGEQGLSPRVRGNLQHGLRHGRGAGSIPACAGEPTSRRWTAACGWVYPRVCGGTTRIEASLWQGQGLSPRVRGNRSRTRRRDCRRRSIPACAGEP